MCVRFGNQKLNFQSNPQLIQMQWVYYKVLEKEERITKKSQD